MSDAEIKVQARYAFGLTDNDALASAKALCRRIADGEVLVASVAIATAANADDYQQVELTMKLHLPVYVERK